MEFMKKVYLHHDEWCEIAKKLGAADFAEDIVMESYIALMKYADESKLIDENGEVRKGYIYFTIRSLYYQYYNKKKLISKVDIDDQWELFDDSNLNEQNAYHDICKMIDDELENWDWYDKLLFKTYRDSGLSMRQLSKGTGISLISIFNSIKNHKAILKDKFQEDYDNYKLNN